MKVINRIIIAVFIFLLCKPSCYGYDDENVHPAINENAANQSTVDTVLKQLGYIDGLKQGFKKSEGITKEALGWIKKGGKDEDDAPRFIDHFHDPSKPWESAGFLTYGGMSSLLWAQDPVQEYSWLDARLAYLEALETKEKAKFAKTIVGH